MELDKYQELAHGTAAATDIEIFTLGLFGEAGSVASSIKKLKRDNAAADAIKDEIRIELGDVLWYLAEIATLYDMKLSEIASRNLEKTKFLFTDSKKDLDAAAPLGQRLPKTIEFEFRDGEDKAVILADGVPFGDPLDDNAHYEDGYRFHDIFHIAYMTFLGWSPVIRKGLNRKRKYNKKIDQVEDGARALFLEEGLSVFVFNQNVRSRGGVSTFTDRGNVPFAILAAIKTMTKGLEVESRSISVWLDAITMGFRAFDFLTKNKGGVVLADREARTLTWERLPAR
jgi:NTP pyrophosphatase (non-canonical NTP hydrolase)